MIDMSAPLPPRYSAVNSSSRQREAYSAPPVPTMPLPETATPRAADSTPPSSTVVGTSSASTGTFPWLVTIGWVIVILFVCAVLVGFLYLVIRTYLGRVGKKCKSTVDCSVGQICGNGICVAPDGSHCRKSSDCLPGSDCVTSVCVYTYESDEDLPTTPHLDGHPRHQHEDLAHAHYHRKRPRMHIKDHALKKVRLRNKELAEQSRSVRVASNHHVRATGDNLKKTADLGVTPENDVRFIDTSQNLDEENDMLAQNEKTNTANMKLENSRDVAVGRYTPVVVKADHSVEPLSDVGGDIEDMAFLGDCMVFLTEGRGNLVIRHASGQVMFMRCDKHLEKICGFGTDLLGVADGVLYKATNLDVSEALQVPVVCNFEEVLTPTREIVHWSVPQDGSRLLIRDLDQAYELDQTFNVLSSRSTTSNRFYGKSSNQYIDVDDHQHRGVDSSGTVIESLQAAAFLNDEVVSLTTDDYQNGWRKVYVHGGHLFYVIKQ